MYPKKLLAVGGATLMLAALPAAAGATNVTVRVEGHNKALLAPRTVHVRSGWITRYGAPRGKCPASSAQGALDAATSHRWRGTWTTQFGPEYEVTSILGETHSFSSKYYWEIFTNNVAATAGGCEIKLHRGETLLFAAVPQSVVTQYPLGVSVPSRVIAGRPFDVKVVYYNAKGKARPLANAKVTLGGISAEPVPHGGVTAKTNAKGIARVTESHAGLMDVTASKAGSSKVGYIRAAPVVRDVS